MPWKPGQSGNTSGRPRQARNKLSFAFLNALAESFQKDGKDAIARVVAEDPAKYLTILASMVPKELEVTQPTEELTHDEIREAIAALRSQVVAGVAGGDGQKADAEGGNESEPTQVH